MNIVFLGTPDFSIPVLRALNNSKHNILLVVTQKDKPKGRGNKLCMSPVKEEALRLGLKVACYDKIRVDGVEELKSLNPDILITSAYGQILSKEILEIAKYGVINVHASLLPKYRGSCPINYAIIKGETETGITIMQTAEGVDTGDILLQEKVEIDENETAGELFDKLSLVAPNLLLTALDKIESGEITPIKQDEEKATHTKMLNKAQAKIDFSLTAKEIHNFIRGMNPWPTAYFNLGEDVIKVFSSEVLEKKAKKQGEVVYSSSKTGLVISASDYLIRLTELQKPSSKRMADTELLKGYQIEQGTIID